MMFLQTERLELSDYQPGDWRDVARLHSDPDVTRYLLDAVLAQPLEATVFIKWIRAFQSEHPGLGVWRVTKRSNGEFLGNYSLMPFEGTEDIEIGGRLLKAAWGLGLSIEGGEALLKHAFETLTLPRVVSVHHPDNHAAERSLIALGFAQQGIAHHYDRDVPFYVLTRDAWREHHANTSSWRERARMHLRGTQAVKRSAIVAA